MELAEGWPGSCSHVAGRGSGSEVFGRLVGRDMVPDGVVVVMTSDDCASEPASMQYPTG